MIKEQNPRSDAVTEQVSDAIAKAQKEGGAIDRAKDAMEAMSSALRSTEKSVVSAFVEFKNTNL